MTIPDVIATRIRDIVGAANYLDSVSDRAAYAFNSFVAYAHPAAVVLFQNKEQVKQVLPLLYDANIPMVIRGSGTNIAGSALAPPGGIVLSLEQMTRILEVDPKSRFIRVEAGANVKAIQEAAAAHGLMFPPNPGNVDAVTAGGIIGCNSAGDLALAFGSTRDYVLQIEALLGDGGSVNVGSFCRKDVTGYDIVRLLVGAEGTLAVVVEATLRLVPKPEAEASALAAFPTMTGASDAAMRLIEAGLQPVALEYMDTVTTEAVESAFKVGFPAGAKSVLLAKYYGNPGSVNMDSGRSLELFSRHGAMWTRQAMAGENADDVWRARHLAYPALARICPTLYGEDTTVPLRHFSTAISRFHELAKEHGVPLAIFAHAGDGNIHPLLLTDDANPEQAEKSERLVEAIIQESVAMGGAITGEHGLGVAKSRFAFNAYNETTLGLMKRVKQAFDPKGLFNPMIFPLVASPPARVKRKSTFIL